MKVSMFILSCFVCLTAPPVAAQSNSKSCAVEIKTLRPGQEVGGRINVEGSATIPAKHHLWVFARHQNYRVSEEWWAQGEGYLEDGIWTVSATIGVPLDIGAKFDVTAAVFDEEQIPILVEHFKANQKLTLPPAICAAKVVTVKKTSD